MSALFFDTHCHLTDTLVCPSLDSSFRIPQNVHYLTVGTSLSDWQAVLNLSHSSPFIYPAIGLHPWFIEEDWQHQLEVLSTLTLQNKLNAIGEIGLDYAPDNKIEKSIQLTVFEEQCALAKQHQLPVSIHCRKAFNDLLKTVKKYGVTGMMHGFSGGLELGQQFVKQGFKLGVNTVILKENARRYHELVQGIGLENLVLETDAPNGQTIHGQVKLTDIQLVAEKISELVKLPVEQVLETTYDNAKNCLIKEVT